MATIAGDGGAALRRLGVRLEQVPRTAQKQVRRSLREAADDVRQAAAARASWSTRIPDSLVVRTSFAGARAGAYIAASARLAGDARPYEGITGRAELRHPLNWPSQRKTRHWAPTGTVRPFLVPALVDKQDTTIDRLNDAVSRALGDAGL